MGEFLSSFWTILCNSGTYVLFGFFIAGVLKAFLPADAAVRWFSGARTRSVVTATLVGVPLPLCSCSVLPTALALRQKGAGKGATVSFLISTPETSATSIFLTYALLGPLMAAVRPVAACFTAIAAGLIENVLQRREDEALERMATAGESGASNARTAPAEASCCGCASPTPNANQPHCAEDAGGDESSLVVRFVDGLRYAFGRLFDDIFGWIIVGVAAAAVIQTFLPADVLQRVLGGPLQSALLMVIAGVPMYVCAEASTPIAAALIAQGLNPGAALVFLLVGPATNLGALGLLRRELGTRSVTTYLIVIIAVALVCGWALDIALSGIGWAITPHTECGSEHAGRFATAGAVVFLVLGMGTIYRRIRRS